MTAVRNSITPEMAALSAEGSDPAKAPWSTAEMLLAAMIDELRGLSYMFRQVNSKEGQAGKPPEPIARPGVNTRKRKVLTMQERMMIDPRMHAVTDGDEGSAE